MSKLWIYCSPLSINHKTLAQKEKEWPRLYNIIQIPTASEISIIHLRFQDLKRTVLHSIVFFFSSFPIPKNITGYHSYVPKTQQCNYFERFWECVYETLSNRIETTYNLGIFNHTLNCDCSINWNIGSTPTLVCCIFNKSGMRNQTQLFLSRAAKQSKFCYLSCFLFF